MSARILLALMFLVGLGPVPAAAEPVPVVGDFDGDGFMDMAAFESTTGEWTIVLALSPRPLRFVWGSPGDIPLATRLSPNDVRDYVGVFRPATGEYFFWASGLLYWCLGSTCPGGS